MVQHLILITGMPGAGKTTIAQMFRDKGYSVMSMGDVIRDLAAERGLNPSSTVLGRLAKEIRSQGGDAAVADRCVDKILKMGIQKGVIDGIRSIAEVKAFKARFDAKLIAVFSSKNTRFRRLQNRKRSDDPIIKKVFDKRDDRELGFSMGHAIALSDYMIVNEGNINDLEVKFNRLLEWLENN